MCLPIGNNLAAGFNRPLQVFSACYVSDINIILFSASCE